MLLFLLEIPLNFEYSNAQVRQRLSRLLGLIRVLEQRELKRLLAVQIYLRELELLQLLLLLEDLDLRLLELVLELLRCLLGLFKSLLNLVLRDLQDLLHLEWINKM